MNNGLRLIWIYFLCVFTSTWGIGQSESIFGKVSDTQGEAVAFANAVLYQLPDSSFVAAQSTDDAGTFSFQDIKDGQYYLLIAMLSYEDYYSGPLALPTDAPLNLDIVLKEESAMLDAVEIVGRVPTMEQRADKLVVNLNNTTALTTNLLDVIKQVPGLIVVNDQVSMAGGTPTILLNGKSTKYMDVQSVLRDMPADNVKSIEVIHQPGAEYEASGSGPVINIVLKKGGLYGTNGSLKLGVKTNHKPAYSTGINLSHYKGNVNIQAGASFNQNAYYEELEIDRYVGSGEDQRVYRQINKNPSYPQSTRGNLSVEYSKNNHTLGVATTGVYNTSDKIKRNETKITSTASETSLITTNTSDRQWKYFTVNPNYKYEMDTSGHKIELDVHMVQFNVDHKNDIENKFVSDASDRLRYLQPGGTRVYTTKLDYTYPIADELTLKAGALYSNAALDNSNNLFNWIENKYVKNNDLSSQYLFDEAIASAYLKSEYKIGSVSGTLGLRYEDSFSRGYSVTIDSTLDRSIRKFFPSASISHPIAGVIGAAWSYSYRIDRPRFNTLNPFVQYLDPYTADRGNPNLRPELTHSFKWSLTYEQQPFFNISYRHINDPILEVTQQNDETGEAQRTSINLGKNTKFSTSLFLPLNMLTGGNVSGYTGVIVNHDRFNSIYLDQKFAPSVWSATTFIQANVNLPWDVNGEVSGYYVSGGQQGIIKYDWLYGVSAGISRKFLDKKLKVSLRMDDMFYRPWSGNIRFSNMKVDIRNDWYAPYTSLKLEYSFGNRHIKDKKNKKSASEVLERIDTK